MKKTMFGFAIIFAFSLAPLGLHAQQNPVTSAVLSTVRRDARNMVAGAQEMPAGKYNYAPTPKQMTFGRMVLHVTQANGFRCSHLGGGKAPSLTGLTANSPKNKLVAAMQTSFGICEQALAKANDSQLSQKVKFYGGHMISKAAAMVSLTTDLADHYAQEAMYLRLNGHLPPTGEGPVMSRVLAAQHGKKMSRGRGGM